MDHHTKDFEKRWGFRGWSCYKDQPYSGYRAQYWLIRDAVGTGFLVIPWPWLVMMPFYLFIVIFNLWIWEPVHSLFSINIALLYVCHASRGIDRVLLWSPQISYAATKSRRWYESIRVPPKLALFITGFDVGVGSWYIWKTPWCQSGFFSGIVCIVMAWYWFTTHRK